MPYIENEAKAKIREVRNSVEPVLDGFTNKLAYYEVSGEQFHWLIEQAERAEIYKKALIEIGSNKFMSKESGIANQALIKADIKFNS